MSRKITQKTLTFCFRFCCCCFRSRDASSKQVPFTSSEPFDSRPRTQEGKPARNLRVPANLRDLTRNRLETLIAMKGPKLEDIPKVVPLSVALAQNSAEGAEAKF